MGIEFSFDASKAASNRIKHGITFDEAATVFGDGLALRIPDPDHSREEDRFILLGLSEKRRLLVVVYAIKPQNGIRIISARRATASEKKAYNMRVAKSRRSRK